MAAVQLRSPTYAPIRQWSAAGAVRAQADVVFNPSIFTAAAKPPDYVTRKGTIVITWVWNSVGAALSQPYPNIVGTSLVSPQPPRNFDYSIQPSNKLSSEAAHALSDNYTNIVINSVPSPIVKPVDYSVQPWNGRVSRAAVDAWVNNYVNRLTNLLVAPTPAIPRDYDYSVQPWNKLSAAAVSTTLANFVNRLSILPEPSVLPQLNYNYPVYPPAVRVSGVAVTAVEDNYSNRLADGLLPFVVGPTTPLPRMPTPNTYLTIGPGPGLLMDRVWYRYFDSQSRRVTLLEQEVAALKKKVGP